MTKAQKEVNLINSFLSEYQNDTNTPFSYGKILNHFDKLHQLKHYEASVTPITLELHLTNRCSHDCLFCMYKDEIRNTSLKSYQLEQSIAENIIRDSKEMGVLAITYSGGGEPTLHPGFKKITALGKSLGLEQGLITNGSNLKRKDIRESILNNFKWVRISMDAGSDITYKVMHGCSCKYETTVQTIKTLLEDRTDKSPKIGISFLLTSFNYSDMIKLYNSFKDTSLDYIQIKPMIMSDEDKKKYDNYLNEESIGELKRIINVSKDASGPKVYVVFDQFKNIIGNAHSFKRCYGHPLYPVISATGDIYVCCMHLYNDAMRYDKIDKDKSFKDIWNSVLRYSIGATIDVSKCPKLCRLAKTNSVLDFINRTDIMDVNFLN